MNKNVRRPAPAKSSGHARAGGALSCEAERLLAALAADGAYAFPDPTAPDRLIVRSGGAGVSVGGGSFAAQAGAALETADLAAWDSGAGRRLVTRSGRPCPPAPDAA